MRRPDIIRVTESHVEAAVKELERAGIGWHDGGVRNRRLARIVLSAAMRYDEKLVRSTTENRNPGEQETNPRVSRREVD